MRAWQVSGSGRPSEVLGLADVSLPEPSPGEMLVRVSAAAVGLPDVFMCGGTYALTPQLPFTPGQEVCGEVLAVGESVSGFSVGQRIMGVTSFTEGHGGFAERCLVGERMAFRVPEDMTDEVAAGFVIPYHTAHIALVRRGHLAAGETVLVLGAAGGSGSAAVSLAAALGARVIAVAGGEDKVAYCRELGAHDVIDHRESPIAESVRALTDDRGVEVVFDPVGGWAFTEATRCIALEGRLLAIGFASGQWGQVQVPHLVTKNYSVVGVMPGPFSRESKLAAHEEMVELWEAGRLVPAVTEVADFDELPTVLDRLADRGVIGKLAVRVAG
ncbi:MAG: NADPH:quinone oxidoreductase family protein [Acidimicrobiales bacterium]|nr:NADPH:quinone oxidoreductase family protein [Acidimicrobiales bacterium]